MARFVFAIVVLSFVACGGEGIPGQPGADLSIPSQKMKIAVADGFVMDFSSNKYVSDRLNLAIENPMYLSVSPSENYVIYSSVQNRDEPEIYMHDPSGQTTRLTDNIFVESYPVVNDRGRYAYVVDDHLNARNIVVLNNGSDSVLQSEGSIRHLAISDSWLASYHEIVADGKRVLVTYELDSGIVVETTVPGIVQKIEFLGDDSLLIQLIDLQTLTLDVYFYEIATRELSLFVGGEEHHYFSVNNDGTVRIDAISGDDAAMLRFQALYAWKHNHLANAFAYSNNYLGRITWVESWLLQGLLGMSRYFETDIFRFQVQNYVAAVIGGINLHVIPEVGLAPDFLWSTKKYSIDKQTLLDLLVDNAMILYPLLRARNMGFLSTEQADQVLSLAEQAFDYYEQDYAPGERLYHIRHGIDFSLDGVWVPYNWQNAFGLVLIELYKATGDQRYADRSRELAHRFRSEWIEADDGRILWHYWPSEFYDGWGPGDGISVNTPSRGPSQDTSFEDTSHAGLNLMFVLEYRRTFGNDTFTDDDVTNLHRTVSGFTLETAFSRSMGGPELDYVEPSYQYIVTHGWSELDVPQLQNFYSSNPLEIIKATGLMTYVNAMEHAAPVGQLTVESIVYGANLQETDRSSIELRSTELSAYFGLN